MTLEQLAKQIFDECAKDGEPVTEEEAKQMAEMEIGAKSIKLNAKSAENKPKKEKIQKIPQVSKEKADLFSLLWEGLSNYYENAEIVKQNKLIHVKIGEKVLKIDIIEERPKKK